MERAGIKNEQDFKSLAVLSVPLLIQRAQQADVDLTEMPLQYWSYFVVSPRGKSALLPLSCSLV